MKMSRGQLTIYGALAIFILFLLVNSLLPTVVDQTNTSLAIPGLDNPSAAMLKLMPFLWIIAPAITLLVFLSVSHD